MRSIFVLVILAACTRSTAPATTPTNHAAPAPAPVASAPADRCVEVADHFEPWRQNPDWRNEVSPRDRLIADCRSQHWSTQLTECLLSARAPLELDPCMAYAP